MKKLLAASLAFIMVVFNGYMLLEGAVTNAATVTGTTSASLNWDVYLDVGSEISLTCDNSNMDLGDINGMTGGDLQADRDCNVKTNNATGWKLQIQATSTPAMMHSGGVYSFANRSLTVGAWTNGSASSTFGYSASSTYGTTEGFTSNSTTYAGFDGTSATQISHSDLATDANGATTSLRFRAAVGATRNQQTGHYNAHVIVTATNI